MELRFDRFTLAYSRVRLFDNWTFKVALTSGSRPVNLGIMGSSGIGKTSLLRAILGGIRGRTAGITLSPAVSTISYVPQEPVIFQGLSARGNAAFLGSSGSHQDRFNQGLFDSLTERLHLTKVLASKEDVRTLSGGERQRIMLLRALSIRPELLILDEPCTGMDLSVKQEFLYYLRSLMRDLGVGVVYVSHHWDEIQLLCDRVLYLTRDATHGGQVVDPILRDTVAFAETPPTLGAFHSVFGLQATVWPVQESDGEKYIGSLSREQPPSDWVVACEPLHSPGASENARAIQFDIPFSAPASSYRITTSRTHDGDNPTMGQWTARGLLYHKSAFKGRVRITLRAIDGEDFIWAHSMS